MSVSREQRFSKQHRCPICDGADQDPRGKGVRCTGFVSLEGDYVHCSREELAGAIVANNAGLFAHFMRGECRCGQTHGAPRDRDGDIEVAYDYLDEQGAMLLQVVRKTGKRFLQRRPDGSGGWIWKTAETRRVLYRLPELLAALADNPSALVLVVEGEKDVERARELGFVATCNPGGAGKWKLIRDHAREILRGHAVTVIADNDQDNTNPKDRDKGLRHANEIAESLLGVASVVRVMLPPRGKDLSDWKPDVPELLGAATAAPVYERIHTNGVADQGRQATASDLEHFEDGPLPEWADREAPSFDRDNQKKAPIDAFRAAFPGLTKEQLCSPVGAVPWLCRELRLAPGLPTMVAGYGYSGKTLALQSLALSVASGKFLWELFSVKRGRVVHFDYDQGQRTTIQRYQRLAFAMGIDLADIHANDMLHVVTMPRTFLTARNTEEMLTAGLAGASLAIIDSFTSGFPGTDENDKRSAELLYMLGRVSEATGCVIIIIHHASKTDPNAKGKDIERKLLLRGSGALFGACAVVWFLLGRRGEPCEWTCEKERHEGSDAEGFSVAFDNVSDGKNDRAGVRVRHLDVKQVTEQREVRETARREADLEKLKTKVLELVKKFPNTSGNYLHENIGGKVNRQRFFAALESLAGPPAPSIVGAPGPRRATLWRPIP